MINEPSYKSTFAKKYYKQEQPMLNPEPLELTIKQVAPSPQARAEEQQDRSPIMMSFANNSVDIGVPI